MNDYRWIRWWHKSSGSFPYYIKAMVERARKEHAPQDAIYRNDDGTWATIHDVKNPTTLHLIETEKGTP